MILGVVTKSMIDNSNRVSFATSPSYKVLKGCFCLNLEGCYPPPSGCRLQIYSLAKRSAVIVACPAVYHAVFKKQRIVS